jgi:ParB family chromosome partitioning protein
MTRKALGRGLSALLREADQPAAVNPTGLESIAIDLITRNPFQPRQTFDEAGLKELEDSIRSSGVVQPILVRKVGDRYQLVAGERRWRAARAAGLESIPAVVRELSDREALELALTENLLREDLNPIDAAHGLKALQDTYGLTHEEIAARLGVNRSTITNTLRLLRAAPSIQEMVQAGGLTAGHVRALLALEFENDQERVAALAVKNMLSVRATEELAASINRRDAEGKPEKKEEPPMDPNVRAAVLELERTLGTRVKISGTGQSGHIEIRYYSSEDLSRIFDWITRR